MKNKFKNNGGFSLIELIIAMAILAIIMTAIGSIMGSSVVGHRKSKAEIRIHTAAQETYNQVTDTIMQANEVVIVGCTSSATYDFSKPGEAAPSGELVFYVKNAAMKQFIIDNPSIYGTVGATDANVKFFTQLASSKDVYIKKLIVKTSAPIKVEHAPSFNAASTTLYVTDNLGLTDELVEVKKVKEVGGQPVYNVYDNAIHTYTFDGENMYYEVKYSFMTKLNDIMDTSSEETMEDNLYNSALSYVVADITGVSTRVSGCIANVDASKGAIGIEFQFNDKKMTYTTNGMVNIRNSYILKAREK